jgi:hypothetical protein
MFFRPRCRGKFVWPPTVLSVGMSMALYLCLRLAVGAIRSPVRGEHGDCFVSETDCHRRMGWNAIALRRWGEPSASRLIIGVTTSLFGAAGS